MLGNECSGDNQYSWPFIFPSLPMLGFNSTFGTVGLKESVHWSSPKCFLWLHLHYQNSIARLTWSRKKRRSRNHSALPRSGTQSFLPSYEPNLSKENLRTKSKATCVVHMPASRANCGRSLRQKTADICDQDVERTSNHFYTLTNKETHCGMAPSHPSCDPRKFIPPYLQKTFKIACLSKQVIT